jgi:nucleoside-diphosphate-sugar epimerase
MRALVTGAAGFIGRALCARLLESGWQVTAVVHRPDGPPPASPLPDPILPLDLSRADPAALQRAIDSCDVVYHAAAIRNRWNTPSERYEAVNISATQALLNVCAGRVGRFVYLSSVGVVGFPGRLGIDEQTPSLPRLRNWDYHTSKAEAERRTLAAANRLEVVVARPTITYGPGDRDGMVTKMFERISAGRFLRVGAGQNFIHLTYIDDLIDGLLLAGTRPEAAGQVFIFSGPEPVQMGTLINHVAARVDRPVPDFYIPAAPARWLGSCLEWTYRAAAALGLDRLDQPPITAGTVDVVSANRSFSSAKAAALLGYRPKVGLADGLENTLCWLTAAGRLPNPAAAAAPSPTRRQGIL